MQIATSCPGCQAKFLLDERLASKKVRCTKCQRVFDVPKPEPAPAPTPAPAPAKPPLMSLSIDDEPVPAKVVIPKEEPIVEATIVEPKKEEIIEATLVTQAPQEEIIEATLAPEQPVVEATVVTPIAPAPRAKPKPPPMPKGDEEDDEPKPKSARGRSTPPKKPAGVSMLAVFAIGSCVLAVLVVIGVAALAFVKFDPPKVAKVDNRPRDFGKDRNKDFVDRKDFFDKKDLFNDKDLWRDKDFDKEKKDFATVESPWQKKLRGAGEFPVDGVGKGTVNGVLPAANSFRVRLAQGNRYNFFVSSKDFNAARIEIRRDDILIAERDGKGPLLLSHVADATADHLITVTAGGGQLFGNLALSLAPYNQRNMPKVNLVAQNQFRHDEALRLEDCGRLNAPVVAGPVNEYTFIVRGDTEVQIKVTSNHFQPIVRLHEKGILLEERGRNPNTNAVEFTFRSERIRAIGVQVTSEQNGLGDYTIEFTKKNKSPELRAVQQVAFDGAGNFNDRDNLAADDLRDAFGSPHRTFVIPVDAGSSYDIDATSTEIDSYLRLYDPQGKLVREDDNGGGDLNARVLLDAKAGGQYRVVLSDVKKGAGAYSVSIKRFALPAGRVVNQPIAGKKNEVAGCNIDEFDIDRRLLVLSCFAWAPDGRAVFLLDRDGVLRRYRYPEMIEDRNLQVGSNSVTLHRCSEGLLVSHPKDRQLWLVNPTTLAIQQRFNRPGNGPIVANPSHSKVYATGSIGFNSVLGQLDVANQAMSQLSSNQLAGVNFHAVTADGRYFLAGGGGNQKLSRWRLDGKLVREEEGGFWMAYTSRYFDAVHLSPDGQYFYSRLVPGALPKSEMPASGLGMAVYRVTDMSKAAFVVDTDNPVPAPAAAAFVPKQNLFCAYSKTKGVIVTDLKGKVLREIPLPTGAKKGEDVLFLTASPDGTRLVAIASMNFRLKVFSIELPRDLVKVEPAAPRDIAFGGGEQFTTTDRLAEEDPRDDRNQPVKAFKFPVHAGYSYNIEQRSSVMDSFLTLTDGKGKTIAQNHGSSVGKNATIYFDASESGEMQVNASLAQGPPGSFTLEVKRFKLPVRSLVKAPLKTLKLKVGEAPATEFTIGAAKTLISTPSVWTPDGKALLHLDAEGHLRRIRIEDFTEEASLPVGSAFKSLFSSGEGILLVPASSREVWIIDPSDLTIRRRLPISASGVVYTTTTSKIAFTRTMVPGSAGSKYLLTAYDLTGKSLPVVTEIPHMTAPVGMTSDGKFLLGRSRISQLTRWRVEDDHKVTEDEAGEAVPPLTTARMVVSPDGKWLSRPYDKVAMPKEMSTPAPASQFGFVVYRTSDLTKPAFAVDTGAPPHAIAFDPKNGHIYASSDAKGIRLFDAQGRHLKSFAIENGEPQFRYWRLIPHPDGQRLLAIVGPPDAPRSMILDIPAGPEPKKD